MTEKAFIATEAGLIKSKLKPFPGSFLSECETKTISLSNQRLTMGDEFFGEFEVINSRRNVVHSTPSVYEAKYVVYASRERVAEVPVPLSNDIIIATVRAYEKHLDELMTLIAGRYSTAFPEGRNAAVTATECLRLIDVVRF